MAQIKLKRGLDANVAALVLAAGEPAFATDTGKLYVGIDGTTSKITVNPALLLDSTPSEESDNAVSSGGVYDALQDLLSELNGAIGQNSADDRGYTDTQVAFALSKVKSLAGFVSGTEPDGEFVTEGMVWYQSGVMPEAEDFPVQVKTFTGGAWSGATSNYTPAQMDVIANLNNNLAYSWFGSGWKTEDLATDEDTLDLTAEGLAEVKPQSFTITESAEKFTSGTSLGFKAFWQSVLNKINGIISALALKAPLASPELTGTPTAPTAANSVSDTQIATTAFVHSYADAAAASAVAVIDGGTF
jgi:hypothetical protein